jgi:hypothetical protein
VIQRHADDFISFSFFAANFPAKNSLSQIRNPSKAAGSRKIARRIVSARFSLSGLNPLRRVSSCFPVFLLARKDKTEKRTASRTRKIICSLAHGKLWLFRLQNISIRRGRCSIWAVFGHVAAALTTTNAAEEETAAGSGAEIEALVHPRFNNESEIARARLQGYMEAGSIIQRRALKSNLQQRTSNFAPRRSLAALLLFCSAQKTPIKISNEPLFVRKSIIAGE